MASAIFNVFFKIIGYVVSFITAPINLILINFFPDFATIIVNFNNGVSTLIGGGLSWFSSLIPPITKATILFYLGILIAYYVIAVNVHIILKAVTIIKNLKIW